jgi:hypothetical protein
MIQINLLPDVKASYVKAERTKKTVITLTIIICAVAFGIVGMLGFVVYGAQGIALNQAQDDINKKVTELKSVQDLDKILTIQNQLGSLDTLHDSKPITTKLANYLQQTTPVGVRIDTIAVNFADSTVQVTGNAPNLEVVNKYVDTLKFTQLKKGEVAEGEELPRAFSAVVLSSFSKNESETTYDITYKFDPSLFDSQAGEVAILVPAIITTRSQTEAPLTDIFKLNEPQPRDNQQGGQ